MHLRAEISLQGIRNLSPASVSTNSRSTFVSISRLTLPMPLSDCRRSPQIDLIDILIRQMINCLDLNLIQPGAIINNQIVILTIRQWN
jgi:hypothetical protein